MKYIGVGVSHKQKLYGDNSYPSQLQFSVELMQLARDEGQRDGTLCSSDLPACMCMCGSAHDCNSYCH